MKKIESLFINMDIVSFSWELYFVVSVILKTNIQLTRALCVRFACITRINSYASSDPLLACDKLL